MLAVIKPQMFSVQFCSLTLGMDSGVVKLIYVH